MFFFGAITFVATTAISGWVWAALSWHTEVLEPATARLLLDVASFWGPVLTGSTVAMLAAVVASRRRELGLPRWLVVLGALALAEQLVETVTVFARAGFIAPGGPMNLFLGAVLTLAWSTSLGIVLSRRSAGARSGVGAARSVPTKV